jgi:hypothetical protein
MLFNKILFMKVSTFRTLPVFFLTSFLIFLMSLLSCNNSPTPVDNNNNANGSPAAQLNSPITIQNLYMDRSQFDKLEIATGHTPEFSKFVFEFTFASNPITGSPSLSVKEAKANNKQFGSDSITLHYATGSAAPQPNLFFSTLQFDAKAIRDAFRLHTSQNCAIYFVAQSDPHLYYQIYVVDNYTVVKEKQLDSAELKGLDYLGNANPSPPHNSF